MPFTLAHPAVVLPFNYVNRKYVSFAGLICGSVAPDFDYFLTMKQGHTFKSHTWYGLFLFDLPMGILLLAVYFGIVCKPFIYYLPIRLKSRLWQYRNFSWKYWVRHKWFIIVFSLLLGSVLHILWDIITHESVQFMSDVLSLNEKAANIAYRNPYYFLVWNINSLLGMVLIGWSIWRLPVSKEVPKANRPYRYWLGILLIAFSIFSIRILAIHNTYITRTDYVLSAISSLLLSLVLTSYFFRKRTSDYIN